MIEKGTAPLVQWLSDSQGEQQWPEFQYNSTKIFLRRLSFPIGFLLFMGQVIPTPPKMDTWTPGGGGGAKKKNLSRALPLKRGSMDQTPPPSRPKCPCKSYGNTTWCCVGKHEGMGHHEGGVTSPFPMHSKDGLPSGSGKRSLGAGHFR